MTFSTSFSSSVSEFSEADVEGHVLQISVIPSSPWVIDKTSPISGSSRSFFLGGDGTGPTREFLKKNRKKNKDAKLAEIWVDEVVTMVNIYHDGSW